MGVINQRVEIQEPGIDYVTIKRLGWRALEDAKEARQVRARAAIRALGGDIYRVISEVREELQDAAKQQAAPADTYDTATLLYRSIVDSGVGPLKPEAIDELSLESVDAIVGVIYELNGIGKAAEPEADRKNDFSPSTDTLTATVEG